MGAYEPRTSCHTYTCICPSPEAWNHKFLVVGLCISVTRWLALDVFVLPFQVWDYVYLGGALPPASCGISEALLQRMRREFEYWYPFDLRVSGKDLIQNHLTFTLYK